MDYYEKIRPRMKELNERKRELQVLWLAAEKREQIKREQGELTVKLAEELKELRETAMRELTETMVQIQDLQKRKAEELKELRDQGEKLYHLRELWRHLHLGMEE